MNRLSFRFLLLVLAAGMAVAAEPARPNILFISMDDLNDWLSIFSERAGVKTPNFERLAALGEVFSNAHCAAPVCNPSRTAIFTGRRPSTTGVYTNAQ
jgi:arylsulfatase A-like enzyme